MGKREIKKLDGNTKNASCESGHKILLEKNHLASFKKEEVNDAWKGIHFKTWDL